MLTNESLSKIDTILHNSNYNNKKQQNLAISQIFGQALIFSYLSPSNRLYALRECC